MSNPFDGIISDDIKLLYYQAIEGLLESLALPCQIIYGTTSYSECSNCDGPIGGRPMNTALSGHRTPTRTSSGCSACGGTGRIPVDSSENINICVIWNPKQFIKIGTINVADGQVQTISRVGDSFNQIKTAKYLLVDTNVSVLGSYKFERAMDPILVGLGGSDFVICNWTRI